MIALENNPQYRMFYLPHIFNFRQSTLHPADGPQVPIMLHTHTFGDTLSNPSEYRELGKHMAVMIFEDGYYKMKMDTFPYGYVCDILVT